MLLLLLLGIRVDGDGVIYDFAVSTFLEYNINQTIGGLDHGLPCCRSVTFDPIT